MRMRSECLHWFQTAMLRMFDIEHECERKHACTVIRKDLGFSIRIRKHSQEITLAAFVLAAFHFGN